MKQFKRYKANLKQDGNKIYSYSTHVATLDHQQKVLHQLGYWSMTTQKHINYVAKEYDYQILSIQRKDIK